MNCAEIYPIEGCSDMDSHSLIMKNEKCNPTAIACFNII